MVARIAHDVSRALARKACVCCFDNGGCFYPLIAQASVGRCAYPSPPSPSELSFRLRCWCTDALQCGFACIGSAFGRRVQIGIEARPALSPDPPLALLWGAVCACVAEGVFASRSRGSVGWSAKVGGISHAAFPKVQRAFSSSARSIGLDGRKGVQSIARGWAPVLAMTWSCRISQGVGVAISIAPALSLLLWMVCMLARYQRPDRLAHSVVRSGVSHVGVQGVPRRR